MLRVNMHHKLVQLQICRFCSEVPTKKKADPTDSRKGLTFLSRKGWDLGRGNGGGLWSLQLGGLHLGRLRHIQLWCFYLGQLWRLGLWRLNLGQLWRLNLWCFNLGQFWRLNLWRLNLWRLKLGCFKLRCVCLWLTWSSSIWTCTAVQ